MAQPQIDTSAVARNIVQRVRGAAQQTLSESRLTKTASVDSRRSRVITELAKIKRELAPLDSDVRLEIEREAGDELGVPEEFGMILKEAGLQALGNLGHHWSQLFGSVGL